MKRIKIVLHKEVVLDPMWYDAEWWEDVQHDRAAFIEELNEDPHSILFHEAGGIDGLLVSYTLVDTEETP
jgi:hypothetical protein